MADDIVVAPKQRRRRRRRRRLLVASLVAILVVAGAGTAWALQGSDSPQYRLAAVQRTDVRETVDADGTLAARKTATAAFASAGTVNSVRVAVGDKVSAGQVLATIDGSALDDAVTSAKATVAQAKQKLADDEDAQADGTSSTSGSGTGGTATSASTISGTSNWAGTASTAVVLVADVKTAPARTRSSGSALAKAQAAVVAAQQRLDAAVTQQDGYVEKLVTSCAAGAAGSPTTTKVTAGADGRVAGSAGDNPVIVTLLDSDGNAVKTVRLSDGGPYSFTGLTTQDTYTVQITLAAVVNTEACTAAVRDVQAGQKAVDQTFGALQKALAALTAAIKQGTGAGAGSGTGSASSPATPSASPSRPAGSGSGPTSSRPAPRESATPSAAPATRNVASGGGTVSRPGTGTSTGGNAGTTVTAEQIAADTKAIDAAQAALAVADQNRTTATLRSAISGTVGQVSISKGAAVSASSSSSAITVVGKGTLSIALSISLADIDLVRVGQHAEVTVDGHSDPLPATVSYVGLLNSASSTGSSSTYSVTVQLDRVYASLYDGMGASVAIQTGSARGVLAVPISAVHTIGTINTVDVFANDKVVPTRVTLGVVGDDTVQVKTGLTASDRVILADIGASVPSSNTSNRRRTGSGLSGLTGGTAGGPPAGGPGMR